MLFGMAYAEYQSQEEHGGKKMTGQTYICWRSPPSFAGWTIFQVDTDGRKEPVFRCESYLEAARMLRQLRSGPKFH